MTTVIGSTRCLLASIDKPRRQIREACEALPTLHTVDLVDLAGVAAGLRHVAVAEGLQVDAA